MDRVDDPDKFTADQPSPAAPVLGEPSLADVSAAIRADKTLHASKRRHWLTSLNRIAEGIGRPAASLPARLTAIRHPVSRLNAARMGIDAKTLANHKSNLRVALLHFGKVVGLSSRGARLSVDWHMIVSAISATKPRRVLSGFTRYCSASEIRPEEVTEQTVEAYFEFRAATSFLETGIARQRELMRAWNDCVEHLPGWPQRPFSIPLLPPSSEGPAWSQYPSGLQRDLENYLSRLQGSHRSANGKRRRPCKSSTIATRRRELIAREQIAETTTFKSTKHMRSVFSASGDCQLLRDALLSRLAAPDKIPVGAPLGAET